MSPRWAMPMAILLIAVALGSNWISRRDAAMDEIDEAAVVYSTYYLGLFSRFDWASPDWQRIDCLDHPPLWKYLHGAALRLGGTVIDSPAPKERWLLEAWDITPEGQQQLAKRLRSELPPSVLRPARLLSTLAFALGALLLMLIAMSLGEPWAGVLAVAALVFNMVVRWTAARALIDGILVALMLGTVLAQLRWASEGPGRERIAPRHALILGVLLGALFNTKITGLLAVASSLSIAALCAARTRRIGPAMISSALVLGCFAATAIALNPSLHQAPLEFTASMFGHRLQQVQTQLVLFEDSGFPTQGKALGNFIQRLLFRPDPLYMPIKLPLFAFAASLGLVALVGPIRRARPLPGLVVAVNLTLWIGATAFTFRLDWPRYILPAFPWIALLLGLGLLRIGSAWSRAGGRALALTALILIAAFLPKHLQVDWRRYHQQRIQLADGLLSRPAQNALIRDEVLKKRAEDVHLLSRLEQLDQLER